MQRLNPAQTAVVIVDVQEKLAAAMPEARIASLVRAGKVLLDASRVYGVPVLVTEQYPAGLGPTLSPLRRKIEKWKFPVFEKVEFDGTQAPRFLAALRSSDPRAVVVMGMEAHVCVFQTARALKNLGLDVYVPIDGVASRFDDHREAGLSLCQTAGAVLTTMETIVFDWMERAGTDAFKKLQKRIRKPPLSLDADVEDDAEESVATSSPAASRAEDGASEDGGEPENAEAEDQASEDADGESDDEAR